MRVTIEVECTAPEGMFEPDYDDIPQECKELLELHGPISCEGTGDIGLICVSPKCHWVDWDEEWEVD